MTTYTSQSIPHTPSPTEKLEQLKIQLTHLQKSPQPTKYEDQQKFNKDCQHIQQKIENLQAFLSLEVGQQVTDGKLLGAIAFLSLSPGGLPEAWVSWYGKVPIPEQPSRLKLEPLLAPNLKVGEAIAINLNHSQQAGKIFEIAEFRGDGWVLTTTGSLFHCNSFSLNLESNCQHKWNRTWSADGRAIKVCQSCQLTSEIDDEYELGQILSSLKQLRQELIDLAAVSKPSRAKDLMQGVKDKDEQIAWVKGKLAMTPPPPSHPSNSEPISSDWKPRVGDRVRLLVNLTGPSVGDTGVIVEIKGDSVRVRMEKESPSGKLVYAEVLKTHVELVEPACLSAVSVEVVELEELTDEEQKERLRLERQVEKAFYQAGQALKKLRDERLYRSTHKSFEEYCQDRFGFTRVAAHYKIAATEVVENLLTIGSQNSTSESVLTNGSQNSTTEEVLTIGYQILPTNERQVRPLVTLDADQQREIWQQAVEEAGGKVPSGRLVKDIVQRIRERTPVPNPFHVGEVCQILVKDNPELRGKGGCWCIVAEMRDFGCSVQAWDGEYFARIENLKLLDYSPAQREEVHRLCERLNCLDWA
ncbi:MAG: hypothetical protein ACRDEA_04350, partial [Microcystaceae cyanobacterium]